MDNPELLKEPLIKENGLRPGDKFFLRPLYGNAKECTLNRNCFNLVSHNKKYIAAEGGTIFLPSMQSQAFKAQIRLLTKPYDPREGRYYLINLHERPFKINHIYTSAAFPMRNSFLDLGYNRVVFQKEGKQKTCVPLERVPPKVIQGKFNVLLEGETGTGKTLLAKQIHQASGVAGRFVHLNLAALSYNLLESELFGHVKGSFTGALRDRMGAFEQAKNGTLFLDEIDSLPKEIQVKLLLVLESMSIRPVGSDFEKKIDTRVIFASGRSLQRMVEENAFREDLFYRITRGYRMVLPPLREMPELLDEVMENFLKENNLSCSSKLIDFYKRQKWPGNIRQLLGHLERKMINTHGFFLAFDEEDEILGETDVPIQYRYQSLEELKVKHTFNTLARMDGNIVKTSKQLKISTVTLRKILKRSGNFKPQLSASHKPLQQSHRSSIP